MAEHRMGQRSASGPGNKQIATTFLESLAVRGQTAARERAMRGLELGEGGLAEARVWLPDDAIRRMFVAADTDASLARSVGHRLVAPDAIGISLYGLGLATTEKAYRRVQALLPRDRSAASWSVGEMGSGSARIEYRDRPVEEEGDAAVVADANDAKDADQSNPSAGRAVVGNRRADAALCALRIGMLEVVPGLFGLLPARVDESTCLARGADACRYQIRWERNSTAGLLRGAIAGGVMALGFVAAALVPTASILSISSSAVLATGSIALALALGRLLDLHRQLEAVAGARRGHLALFDQVDDVLASKLDALARVDAKLEANEFPRPLDRLRGISADGSSTTALGRQEIRTTALAIHAAAGDLECWFEDDPTEKRDSGTGSLGDGTRDLVREIRNWAAKIVEDSDDGNSRPRVSVDLAGLVARAIAAVRPMIPPSTRIKADYAEGLAPIICEPIEIEQVVVQLLRNAAEASCALSEFPEVLVSLCQVASGIELAVEDRGVGMEPSQLDEVFDPFFGDLGTGIDEGFGLTACLSIIERHGGELRFEAEDRPGTRVSILLPTSSDSTPR